jgi:hypothetical protein
MEIPVSKAFAFIPIPSLSRTHAHIPALHHNTIKGFDTYGALVLGDVGQGEETRLSEWSGELRGIEGVRGGVDEESQ